MSELDLPDGSLLAQGETFIVRGAGRIVWCKISVPRGLAPARGAVGAGELGSFLLDHVLERHSAWLGVVMDLRDGPSILGPISLQIVGDVCARAELVRRRLAIWMGAVPLLKEQLSTLVHARAPRFAIVTEERRVALDWMTSNV